jgi:hypothetical protein
MFTVLNVASLHARSSGGAFSRPLQGRFKAAISRQLQGRANHAGRQRRYRHALLSNTADVLITDVKDDLL